jgi:DNA replication and repair protein RecF
VGDNGAGKTNLLEAVHVATQGFSPRTRADSQLIRFGCSQAAIAMSLSHGEVDHQIEVRVSTADERTTRLDGVRLSSADTLRRSFPTLVFTPDRLSVVKGGPAVRRAYFDRSLGRLYPAQAGLPVEYGAAVSQRNAALRRVGLGVSPRSALDPWTAQVSELGTALVAARRAALDALRDGFTSVLRELGVAGASLCYAGDPPAAAALEARLDVDIDRGTTGIGPHRDDILIEAAGRDLRSYGSQGQQRLVLLALLLAEAELVPASPLLLLDDVLSELDARRRRLLAGRVAALQQTLVTSTHASALPVEPSQIVEVSDGQAR